MYSKVCRKCGEEKPIDDFYKHSKMLDGHLNICKKCVKERVSKHRQENVERFREYDRIRAKGNKRRLHSIMETAKRRKQVSNYQKCHNAVMRAVTKGELTRSNVCQVCGRATKTVGHHADYNNEKSVVWLCRACHSQYHTGKGKLADMVRTIVNNITLLRESRQNL